MLATLIVLSALSPGASASIDLPTDLGFCEQSLLHFTGKHDVQNPRRQIMDDLLAREPLNSALLIEFMAGHPLLKPFGVAEAFAGPAGVTEGYSLREHTRMVLDLFAQQRDFYDLTPEFKKLLTFTLIFHDIGKPAAIDEYTEQNGRAPESAQEFKVASRRQWEWTWRVLPKICARLGLTDEEINLMRDLLADDLLGELVTNKTQPHAVLADLGSIAMFNHLKTAQIFAARTLMFVADAGSYPGLRYGRELSTKPKPPVFVQEVNGRLVPVSPRFHELDALIHPETDEVP